MSHAMDKAHDPRLHLLPPAGRERRPDRGEGEGAGRDIKVGRFKFGGNGKAIALGEPEGLVKTVFDAKTGKLLGAHMVGAEVTELIQGFVVAMNLETTEEELMHTIFPHPTRCSVRQAGEGMHAKRKRAGARRLRCSYGQHGAPAEAHIGRCIFDIVPDLRMQAEPILRRVLDTGEAVADIALSGETAKAPGVRRDWLEHFHPVRSETGDVVGVGVICEEVTARRAAERRLSAVMAELSRTLHLFRVALRAADVTAFAMDRERRFIWVSEGAWGWPAEDIVGLRDEDVFPESRWSVAVPIKDKVLAEGGQQTFDVSTELGGRRVVLQIRIEAMRDENDAIFGLVGASIDITERKAHEAHVESLMRELSHRSKNLLAVIQGLARHSARRSASLPDFLAGFVKRLDSLAQAQDLLTNTNWQGVNIADLIESQLGYYDAGERARLFADGPPIHLSARAVQNLGMALHELSTNAVKYGALSAPGGRVDLTWGVEGAGQADSAFWMRWIESGGPPVTTPGHKGFGHVVTQDLAARALLGKVTLDFAPQGLRWSLVAPTSSVIDRDEP
jgi:PAS domain S-box-containing protein